MAENPGGEPPKPWEVNRRLGEKYQEAKGDKTDTEWFEELSKLQSERGDSTAGKGTKSPQKRPKGTAEKVAAMDKLVNLVDPMVIISFPRICPT